MAAIPMLLPQETGPLSDGACAVQGAISQEVHSPAACFGFLIVPKVFGKSLGPIPPFRW